MNGTLTALLGALAVLLTGCERQKVYPVKGVVIEVQPAEKTVEIQHEEIPGYMKAMTMPFDVKNTNELTGLRPGDQVAFRMIVREKDAWIENIRVTGKAASAPSKRSTIRIVRDVEPLSVGDALPEYYFTNEFGAPVNTAQFRGQALVLSFLFTRCPYPTFCPLTAGNLADTQRRLTALPNAPTNWHILAITIDPGHDTSAVMREWGQRFGYQTNSWSFLTGELIDITALAEQFGMTFWHENGNDLPTHNLRTVVVNSAGKIQSIVSGNKWTVDELVQGVVKAAAVKP